MATEAEKKRLEKYVWKRSDVTIRKATPEEEAQVAKNHKAALEFRRKQGK